MLFTMFFTVGALFWLLLGLCKGFSHVLGCLNYVKLSVLLGNENRSIESEVNILRCL